MSATGRDPSSLSKHSSYPPMTQNDPIRDPIRTQFGPLTPAGNGPILAPVGGLDMLSRVVVTLAFSALVTSSLAQDTATPPALGYKDSFQTNYLNFEIGESAPRLVLIATNMGFHGAGGTWNVPADGDICMQMYTFNWWTGDLLNCCSCRIWPNSLRRFREFDFPGPGGEGGSVHGTLLVKLIATRYLTAPPPRQTRTGCDPLPSASEVVTQDFATGMRAWGNHNYTAQPGNQWLAPAGAAFSPGPLGAAELNKLNGLCSALLRSQPSMKCSCGEYHPPR